MRHLLSVIYAVVVLVAAVTGCGGAHRYDARLAAADSLMRTDPDSALSLVWAIDRDSLSDEGDRAYRDLLLTQARYKAYVPATSDSDINRALAYYRAHPKEREKLTRAYIYKGAVMEELGHPDSAMLYYKTAEATAAPDDYFNLGYSKLRIGELYQYQLPLDSAGIRRLLEARQYFKWLNDTHYLIVTLGKLGAISGVKCTDSAKLYLEQSIRLAQEFDPRLQYTSESKLAGVYLYENDFRTTNQLAMDVFLNGKDFCDEEQYYYYASVSFLKLGLIDSAKYIVSSFPAPRNSIDSMNYYNIMAAIAEAENKPDKYGKYTALSKEITSRIIFSKTDKTATQFENNINNDRLEQKSTASRKFNVILCLCAGILTVLLIVVLIKSIANIRRYEKEKSLIRHELESTLAKLRKSQQINDTKQVSQLLGLRMDAIKELYQSVRIRIKDEKRIKKVVPLASLFDMMKEKDEILKIQPSDSFWDKMKLSVNGEFNNIISFIEQKYPNLTERDIHLLCLLCANISPHIIQLCMNLENVRSVSNYKNRILKHKMSLDVTFEQFIQNYIDGNTD